MNDTAPTKISGYTYITSSGGIHEYRLDKNGLTVLVMEDHSAPVAAFMVTYLVGSRNEATGHTGATHLLEHLMFKGSKNFNKENGKSVWNVLEAKGGAFNATTWYDRTNYYAVIPTEHIESVVALEADRMRNAFLRGEDKDAEMTVVRNEFEQNENNPRHVLDKAMWATAFQAHPYHHSTIGWRSDIEKVSIERLQKFYDTFYWPNNAVVTFMGDMKVEAMLELVKKHFEQYDKAPNRIPEVYTEEPLQEGPRRVTVKRIHETNIIGIAFKVPSGLHEDTHAIQLLSHILGGGTTSRLYRALVDKGYATGVEVSSIPLHDGGLLELYVTLAPGTAYEKVEKLILKILRAIQEKGVTKKEFQQAQQQIIASEILSRDGVFNVMAVLNEAIALGDWKFYTTFAERIKGVSQDDVRRVAQQYLVEDRSTTGLFIAKKHV